MLDQPIYLSMDCRIHKCNALDSSHRFAPRHAYPAELSSMGTWFCDLQLIHTMIGKSWLILRLSTAPFQLMRWMPFTELVPESRPMIIVLPPIFGNFRQISAQRWIISVGCIFWARKGVKRNATRCRKCAASYWMMRHSPKR